MMGGGFGWLGMVFGSLMMLLFWGGLIVLGVLAFRALSHGGHMSAGGSSNPSSGTVSGSGNRALDILRERYARGEITKDEYETMRRDLDV